LKKGHFDYNSRSCANSEQISKAHVYRGQNKNINYNYYF
jgi:hypothetical protein